MQEQPWLNRTADRFSWANSGKDIKSKKSNPFQNVGATACSVSHWLCRSQLKSCGGRLRVKRGGQDGLPHASPESKTRLGEVSRTVVPSLSSACQRQKDTWV